MEYEGSNQVVVSPMGFVRTDSAPQGFDRRDFVCRDPGSATQHSIDYQTVWQEQHTVAGNSDKDLPAVVDNFDMGQTEFALGVASDHKDGWTPN